MSDNTHNRELQQTGRWVVKVGSSLVTDNGTALNLDAITAWADQLAALQKQGKELLLVSSGSVAEGMRRLGWDKRPHEVHELQAAAAVGQMGLVQAYETAFQQHDIHTAQILLTHEEIRNRQQYLNARSTMRTLVQLGVIPVINENDTIAFDEIRLGDNDNLAAMVANLVEADLLVILTDQSGLYDKNPVTSNDAKLVQHASANDTALDAMAGDTAGKLGRGGMATKLQAARRAARSGTMTIIASGREPNVLQKLAAGDQIGTLLVPDQEPLAARKQWLAGQLQVEGQVMLDDGAVKVLKEQGTSLLAVGVTGVKGKFTRGDLVVCVDSKGREVARGLINYNIDETRKIMGKPTSAIEATLGYIDEPELINRDDLVLL